MVKYSPGPWIVNDASTDADPGKLSVEADDGEYFICQVDGGIHQRANAQLIAAAPEILEALELAAETFRRYEGHHRAKQTPDAFEKALANQALAVQLEAVIAKAKGLNPDQG